MGRNFRIDHPSKPQTCEIGIDCGAFEKRNCDCGRSCCVGADGCAVAFAAPRADDGPDAGAGTTEAATLEAAPAADAGTAAAGVLALLTTALAARTAATGARA